MDRDELSDPPDHSHGDEEPDQLLPAQEEDGGVGLLLLVVHGYLKSSSRNSKKTNIS